MAEFVFPKFVLRPEFDPGDLKKADKQKRQERAETGSKFTLKRKAAGGRPSLFTDEQELKLKERVEYFGGEVPPNYEVANMAEKWDVPMRAIKQFAKRKFNAQPSTREEF